MQEELTKKLEHLSAYIAENHFDRTSLIEILHEIQTDFGYIPIPAMDMISNKLSIPVAEIFGVVTFYAHFKLYPAGKYNILLCQGTACHVNNAAAMQETLQDLLKIKTGQTTPDGLFSINTVACLGCCSLSPVMQINGKTYGSLTKERIARVIEVLRARALSEKVEVEA